MRLDQLKFLVTVADLGSFTEAGEVLHVAQPSISHSIAALEKELGVTLLTRSRSGVGATEIGEEVIRLAKNVLDEARHIKAVTAAASPAAKTVITLAPALSAGILPKLLAKVGEVSTRIEIIDAATDKAEHLLAKGEADLALVPYVDPGDVNGVFQFTPLFKAQTMAVIHENATFVRHHSLSFEEIQKHPISIFNSEYISFEPIMNRIREYGDPNVLLKTHLPQPRLTKAIAENNNCVAISFDITIISNNYEGMKALYIDNPVQLTFGLLEKKGHVMSSTTKAVRKQLLAISENIQRELAAFHESLLAE